MKLITVRELHESLTLANRRDKLLGAVDRIHRSGARAAMISIEGLLLEADDAVGKALVESLEHDIADIERRLAALGVEIDNPRAKGG